MTSSTFPILGCIALLVTGFTLYSINQDQSSARRTYHRKLATDMKAVERLIQRLGKSRLGSAASNRVTNDIHGDNSNPHSLRISNMKPMLSIYFDQDAVVFRQNLVQAHKEFKEDWKSLVMLEIRLAYKAPCTSTQTATATTAVQTV
ncbi:hypothetical protein BGZ83_004750 [Gryganskiella cystojenkinii]|nr:hypothetical protein BGZ83_004750 [Gryganskiella cystojenkinii]